MSSKLHAILSSRAILNNEDRAIIEPQIKALMLETYDKALQACFIDKTAQNLDEAFKEQVEAL